MNYFLHYIIDSKQGQPYYNFGLLLPDFGKHHFSTFHHLYTNGDIHLDIVAGCAQHILSDKQFHASPFFEQQLQIVKSHMSQTSFTPQLQRKWFIAHILMELMLDRMMCIIFPYKLDEYYNDLMRIEKETICHFFEQNHATHFDLFWQHFEHFRSVQYIRYYVDNNKLVYSLSRIMQRVGLDAINEIDTDLMMNLIETIEKDYFANAHSLPPNIKAIFI